MGGGLAETFHQTSAICPNDGLRGGIVRQSGDVDKRQTLIASLDQHKRQGTFGIAAALLPRHHRIADMAEHMRRKLRCSRLPAQADAATETTVPHPAAKTWQPRNSRAVRELDWRAFGFRIIELRDEPHRVGCNLFQFFLRGYRTT